MKNTNRIPFAVAALAVACASLGTLQAQTFANVPALSFTKVFAGSNPLPQVVSVVTTNNSVMRFTATATTTTGGTWLTTSPTGTGCCYTPEAITVTVNPLITLAAGTYTGQIVFTAYPTATTTLTVPVTLIVAAAGTPFFDTTPGQMTFSLQTGGAPPAQPLQIRNGGSGALNWSLTASTADGGGWLTASVSSGQAPSTVSIGVVPGSLPGGGAAAGTFVGQLRFNSSGGSVTIPVNVVVGDTGFTQISPLSFTKPFGGANPLPQVVLVTTTSASVSRFSVSVATSNGGTWLLAAPSGVGCCYTPESIGISVNPSASLAAGSYTGQVTVISYPGNDVSMTIPVTLTVAATTGPLFDNAPGQMTFSLKTGRTTNPAAQTLQIRNAGVGTLNWALTATTADGNPWLSVSAVSGTAPATLTVSVITQNLPNAALLPFGYSGNLLFRSATGNITVPISVVVGDITFSQLNPISFTKPFGGANPLPQVLAVSTSDASVARFTVSSSTANGGAWLVVAPTGVGCCYTPEAVTVSVNPSPSLAAGSYTGQVTITSYPGSDYVMTVPVTLTVAAAGTTYLGNLPGQLSYSLTTGRSTNPAAQSMQILKAGPNALNWTLSKSTSDGNNWLNVSAASGAAPATVSVSVTTQLLPNGGLIAGTFTGQLLVRTASSTVTVPISVVVGDTAFNQVNPISFTKTFGGANPLPQVVTPLATGGGVVRFTVAASTGTGGSWLQVSPTGLGCCYTPEAITLTVNPSATLPAGTYAAQVTFTSYPGNDASITVPVTLTIAASGAPYLDNVPGQITFSQRTGTGLNPPSQGISLRSVGGSLNYSMTRSTSDGNNWLNVTPATGSTPGIISVSIVTQNLPNNGLVAGTFSGQIAFRSAGGNLTIPVMVYVGDGAFTQTNPISFNMSAGGKNPLPEILLFSATGGSTVRFTSSVSSGNGGSWLQVTPTGVGCCYTPEAMTVSVNGASLAAGTYTGEINAIMYPGGDVSMTVPVNLTVAPAGATVFDNVQGQMTFSMQPGLGANPTSQQVHIRNAGPGALNWTLVRNTSDSNNWLSVSAGSGTAPSTLTVGVITNNLPDSGFIAGNFTGQVVLQSPTGNVAIPVTVAVGDSVFVQPAPLTFTMQAGGANPPTQAFSGASSNAVIRYTSTAVSGNGSNWLSISPTGLGCCYTPTTMTVSVNGATLPAGTYTSEINFVEYPSNDRTMTLPVTLVVNP
ncbi:MAG: hypothetical protein ABI693_18615 [Bryobacteraceae bacterium]